MCSGNTHQSERQNKMRARERERGGEEKRDGFFPLSSNS